MATFTVDQVEVIANSTLDHYMERRKVTPQSLQDKPLLKALRAKEKTFAGGKGAITGAVKGEYSTGIQGFVNDDAVGYGNPANTKRWSFPWKLLHAGIQFSMHECAVDGISITDSTMGKTTSEHSDREIQALVNIIEEKLDDMEEGSERAINLMYWRDGTQDANLIPGITSLVVDSPAAAVAIGGIDPVQNTWWRNRANLAINLGSTAADQGVILTLQKEYRQLRKFGGNPTVWLAGSDMIDEIEKELRAKGNYTLEGWNSKSKTDGGMADIAFKGNMIQYDPTLDDLGYAKRLYVLDLNDIFPMVIEGENWKRHTPARPHNKYVFYRAKTYMGGLVARKRNGCGVYGFA